MLAEQALREGDLTQSLEHLQEQVRKDPSDARLRVFLFQLLSVLGQWDRALKQLNVAGDLDASTLAMVQMYREALQCEVLRDQIFAGRLSPLVFGEPEEWIAVLIESLKSGAAGHWSESNRLRQEAFDAAPVTAGTIDDQPFEWIADADPRLGPIVEAVVNGRYYWIPFSRIREIHIEEPADLRDLVWAPAYFTWANGGEMVGLIPTRYVGSQASEDSSLVLARKTAWVEAGEDVFLGLGQRMLATDANEYSLLDIRHITLCSPDPAESGDGASGNSSESPEEPPDG